MNLATNTRRLLQQGPDGSAESTAVEYHLLSWRELYDKSIITTDRYSSGAARWVVRGNSRFYTVTVVSRPYYDLPQELCLAFECFTHEIETTGGEIAGSESWLPVEQVAQEFSVLLSVFAREPLALLGLRREAGQPFVETPLRIYPKRGDRASLPMPFGVDSPEFVSVLSGLALAADDLVTAIVGAAKFYHAGLSLIAFDPSVAYTSFVSAIECLAGFHYKSLRFNFDTVSKFDGIKPILERIEKVEGTQTDVAQLKQGLIASEYFLRQKFVRFLEEHVTEEFWEIPDELYKYSLIFPEITRHLFGQCLKGIYDARSSYLHGGAPFPEYVEVGLRQKVAPGMLVRFLELKKAKKFIPPLAWFERLCHIAMVQFMRRSLAPEVERALQSRLKEKERLLKAISKLQSNVQESLRKLVYWTLPFLGAAVINPHAPNREWADSEATIATLREMGLVGGTGDGFEGHSWLKDREIGEVAGEFVFGLAENPFRENELLLPKDWGQALG